MVTSFNVSSGHHHGSYGSISSSTSSSPDVSPTTIGNKKSRHDKKSNRKGGRGGGGHRQRSRSPSLESPIPPAAPWRKLGIITAAFSVAMVFAVLINKVEDGAGITQASNHQGDNKMSLFGASVLRGPTENHLHSKHHKTKHHHKKTKKILMNEKYDGKELYYEDQYLDHIGQDTEHTNPKHIKTYSQRYYKKSKYWKGPGYPILLIFGGEGVLTNMLYPFVYEGLAKEFHAFVVAPEHRFYGQSQPVQNPSTKDLIKYLTPDQALADAVNMIQMLREELGCSPDRTSPNYCPVITFGGSYPGFLSTMMRFRFPDIVDIAYAASAPLELYEQLVDADAYYDKVTEVADKASPGCSNAVRSTLESVRDELLANYTVVTHAAKAVGFCSKHFPKYMKDIPEFISETIMYLVPAIFADFNMGYYPPGPTTALARACTIFEQDPLETTSMERLSQFFDLRGEVEYGGDDKPKCFDLSLELPSGPKARIRGSDNSGTGGGKIFLSCEEARRLVPCSRKSKFTLTNVF